MAPLLLDATYLGLVLPMPGDMSAGRLVNDDDAPPDVADVGEGWDMTDALIVGTRAVKLLRPDKVLKLRPPV